MNTIRPLINTSPSAAPLSFTVPTIPNLVDQLDKTKRKQRRLDIYTGFFKGLLVILNGAFIFSPQIIKKAQTLQQSNRFTATASQKLIQKMANKSTVDNFFWRAITIAYAFTLSHLQIGLNTNQPSKLLSFPLQAGRQVGVLIKPQSILLRSLTFFVGFLIMMGMSNDIANSNHMERRREWDLSRLKKPSEIPSFFKFILGDMKYALSFQPWQDAWKGRKDLSTPNPGQTAIAAQLNLLTCLSVLIKPLSKIPYLIPGAAIGSAVMAQIPFGVRAWKNKSELDGALTLLGIPLFIAGRPFTLSKNYSHISGLSGVGEMSMNEGLRRNSEKYQSALEYLKLLYEESLINPNLTAKALLNDFYQYPDRLQKLERYIGQVRVKFIIETLAHLQQQQAQNQRPLSELLRPIINR